MKIIRHILSWNYNQVGFINYVIKIKSVETDFVFYEVAVLTADARNKTTAMTI